MPYTYTTQAQVRAAFFDFYPARRVKGWTQNRYDVTTRCAFCDFVDALQKEGHISEALADRVTL